MQRNKKMCLFMEEIYKNYPLEVTDIWFTRGNFNCVVLVKAEQ